jgi:hypothetical protein
VTYWTVYADTPFVALKGSWWVGYVVYARPPRQGEHYNGALYLRPRIER